MQISKRDFLRKLGLLGAAGVSGAAARADEWSYCNGKLPEGSVGDQANVWFGHDGVPNRDAIPVPFGALVPKKGENVIAAGRCIGAPDTVDVFRLICPCFATGQAAGVAAALAARKGVASRYLPSADLRNELLRQEGYLG